MNFQVSEKISFSTGGGFSDYMYNDMDAYYTHAGVFETVQNDNMNVNVGGSYKLCQQVTLTAGFMHTAWAKDTKVKALAVSPDSEVTINNSMNVIAIGAEIKF
jgi:long-chain fatty acid transport protein